MNRKIVVSISVETLEALDRFRARFNLSRSKTIDQILRAFLELDSIFTTKEYAVKRIIEELSKPQEDGEECT